MNFKSRFKNPYFWVGLIGVILTAMGVSADTLTSWGAIADAFFMLIKNPFMLGSVALAVLGVFVNPTTKGIADTKKEVEE